MFYNQGEQTHKVRVFQGGTWPLMAQRKSLSKAWWQAESHLSSLKSPKVLSPSCRLENSFQTPLKIHYPTHPTCWLKKEAKYLTSKFITSFLLPKIVSTFTWVIVGKFLYPINLFTNVLYHDCSVFLYTYYVSATLLSTFYIWPHIISIL